MTDLKLHNRISAETVSRLVQIVANNREKDENAFQGKVMRYFNAKARCDKCAWNDDGYKCRFMRINRYYPHKCIGYKEKGENL